jgi:citronellyl-CoA dehydrogenase
MHPAARACGRGLWAMHFTPEHAELRRTVERFCREEINPHVDAWEEAGIFPAHEVFGKLGALGLLGVSKPVEYGGLRLDYSYSVVMAEALGHCRCGGVPMAIGVQTDMATPALARFGSTSCKREYLAPAITGEWSPASASPRSGPGRTSRRSAPRRARTATTTSSTAASCGHQRRAGRLDVPASRPPPTAARIATSR